MAADGKTIYVVDDSLFILARIEALLEEIGAISHIRTATDYRTALDLIKQKVPDIAVLDIHLPDKSGIELLQYLKTNYPAITVIMMSNQSTNHYRSLCSALGASHFIDKSTEFDDLPEILESFL